MQIFFLLIQELYDAQNFLCHPWQFKKKAQSKKHLNLNKKLYQYIGQLEG